METPDNRRLKKETAGVNKLSNRKLQEALDFADNILSTVREPLLVLDAKLRIISANRSFYNMFSVAPQETEGKLIYEVGEGQWNIPKLRELLEEILPKNTNFNDYEVDHDFPNLGKRIILLNARRIHDGGAKTQKILLAIEDVTERKRIEHDIESSEVRYRRLFETAQDGILILDAKTGQITDVNPFLIDILGYSKDEFLGKRLWEIGSFKDVEAARAAFSQLQKKAYIRYSDLPLETRDGRSIAVEFVSNVYNVNGDIVIQCNIRDNTSRVKAEEELKNQYAILKSIIESPGTPIFSVDSNYCYTSFNSYHAAVMKELYGADIEIGKSLLDYHTVEQDLLKAKENIDHVFYTGKAITVEDTAGPEGSSRRFFEISHNPIREASGKVFGVSVFAKDVTQHKQLEELQQEFIGLVSHELRNPLTTIMGSLQVVLSEYKRLKHSEIKQLLQDAFYDTESMARIITNLLELSRSQSGYLTLNYEPVSLQLIIGETVLEIQKRSGREISMQIPKDLPQVQGDSVRLQHIIKNLLDNAVKYSPQGGPIRVFVKNDKDRLLVGVSDSGIGIAKADQDKLFKPHERVGNQAAFKGTGIGLLVCRKLVETHGGKIWVESEPDKGSTFFFTIPVK